MDIEQRCSVCKGTGETLDYTEGQDIPPAGISCPRCEGTGKLTWGTIQDLETRLSDIEDKINDIWEKLNES